MLVAVGRSYLFIYLNNHYKSFKGKSMPYTDEVRANKYMYSPLRMCKLVK